MTDKKTVELDTEINAAIYVLGYSPSDQSPITWGDKDAWYNHPSYVFQRRANAEKRIPDWEKVLEAKHAISRRLNDLDFIAQHKEDYNEQVSLTFEGLKKAYNKDGFVYDQSLGCLSTIKAILVDENIKQIVGSEKHAALAVETVVGLVNIASQDCSEYGNANVSQEIAEWFQDNVLSVENQAQVIQAMKQTQQETTIKARNFIHSWAISDKKNGYKMEKQAAYLDAMIKKLECPVPA